MLLKRAIDDAPTDRDFIEAMASQIFQASERYYDGMMFFTQLLKRTNDKNPAAANALAEMYDGLDRPSDVLKYSRLAAATSNVPRYESYAANAALDQGDPGGALASVLKGREKLKAATAQAAKASLAEAELFEDEVLFDIAEAKVRLLEGNKAAARSIIDRVVLRLKDLNAKADQVKAEHDNGVKSALRSIPDRYQDKIAKLREYL